MRLIATTPDTTEATAPAPLSRRYGGAVLSVAAAALLRLGLNTLWGDKLPYLVFFPAVVFSALYGGLGPGLLAIVLSGLAAAYVVLTPGFSVHAASAEDITGLIGFGFVAAIVVLVADAQRRARLRAEAASAALGESEERLRFLAELTERTRTLLDPDAVIEETVRAVGGFLRLSRYLYADVNPDTGVVTARRDFFPDQGIGYAGKTWPLSAIENLVADLRAGKTIVNRDTAADPRTADKYASVYQPAAARATVTVPLLRGGRWVGYFSAVASTPRDWTSEEITLLEAVSERMWASLEAARLYREQQRVAETLQRSLLLTPEVGAFPGIEVCPIYQPAWDEALVGGDFFDAFALDGGKVALVIGDVTGKGLIAATFTAEMKFALRTLLREHGGDPAVALGRLNQHLLDGQRLDGKAEDVFVCLAVAVLDPATGEAAFSVAGGEPPLIVRATGDIEEVAARARMLGALPDWNEEPLTLRVEAGDLLLLLTDGITEARCGKGADFFGMEGVAEAARAALPARSLDVIGRAIVAAAQTHAGGQQADDICLFLARRT